MSSRFPLLWIGLFGMLASLACSMSSAQEAQTKQVRGPVFGRPSSPLSTSGSSPTRAVVSVRNMAFLGRRDGQMDGFLVFKSPEGLKMRGNPISPIQVTGKVQTAEILFGEYGYMLLGSVAGDVALVDLNDFTKTSRWTVGRGPVLALTGHGDPPVVYWGGSNYLARRGPTIEPGATTVIELNSGGVSVLAVESQGQLLAVGHTQEQEVTLWSTDPLKKVGTLQGHEGFIYGVHFVKPEVLVTIDAKGTVREWNVSTKKMIRSFITGVSMPHVQWGRRGELLLMADPNRLWLWHYPTRRLLSSLEVTPTRRASILSVAWDSSQDYCVVAMTGTQSSQHELVAIPVRDFSSD